MEKYIGLILVILSTNLSSQRMLPFHDNGKWGYMTETKEVIVEPMYEEAYPPAASYERYRIKYNGKYGFIDREGQVVIKTIYDKASDFQEGKAKVTLDGLSFDIGEDGKKSQLPFLGDCGSHKGYSCFELSAGLKESTSEIIDIDGELSTVYKTKPYRKVDKHNYSTLVRDQEGNVQYRLHDTLKVFIDSIIPFTEQWLYVVKDSHISFLEGAYKLKADYLPEILSTSRIEEIKLFECELSGCRIGKNQFIGFKENGLWGYYKYNGYPATIKRHIEAKYHSIGSMAKGSALVEYEIGKFGYIDWSGNEYFIR